MAETPFIYRTSFEDLPIETASPDADRAGLTRWLLVALFVLLFVEQLMAWRFRYEFLLLYVVVAAAFAWQAARWNGLAAGGVLLLALAGLAVVLGFAVRRPGGGFSGKRGFGRL